MPVVSPRSPSPPPVPLSGTGASRAQTAAAADAAEIISPPPAAAVAAAAGWTSPAHTAPSPEHLEQIQQARVRFRPIRRAAAWASFSGWSMAVFSFLTVLTSLFDAPGLVFGVGLGVVAYFELRGAKGLSRIDTTAPRRLAMNQLLLGSILLMYSGWGVYRALTGPGSLSQAMGHADPQLQMMVGPVDQLEQAITSTLYIAMMVLALVVPGCTALYYGTRRHLIAAYLEHTPAWIIELNRKGVAV